MEITTVPRLLYYLRTWTTAVYLLFEGNWWRAFLKKTGFEGFTRLVERSHDELKELVNNDVYFTYHAFYSKQKYHWYFDDPLHKCPECQVYKREAKRPSLKNLILNKFGFKKYRHIMFINI